MIRRLGERKRVAPPKHIAKAYQEAMASFDADDKKSRVALAETILFDLEEQIEKDDIINLLDVDVQDFDLGQTPQWRTRSGIKVFTSQPGAYMPRSQMAQRTQTLTTERHGAHPEIEITQLQAGRYGDMQSFRDEALSKLLGHKYGKIWSTLVNSITSTDTTQYQAIGATPTPAALKNSIDSGLDYVDDQEDSMATVIVGRRNALKGLADYEAHELTAGIALSESTKQKLDENLLLPTYRGVPVVYLKQYKDADGINIITENNVMVLGKGTLKLGRDLPLTFLEGVDVDNAMWHVNIFEQYGTGVFDSTKNWRTYLG